MLKSFTQAWLHHKTTRFKSAQVAQKKAKAPKACLLIILKKKLSKENFNKYSLNFFKLKNAKGTPITGTVETLSKYLISSVICVGVLYLLAMFGLHRIEFV